MVSHRLAPMFLRFSVARQYAAFIFPAKRPGKAIL